jgi:hypothetical protein
MSFPLPSGVCRRVCRPVRSPPRLTGWREAVRFAKAAVKNGDDPCFVASQVAIAVGCDICGCGEEMLAVEKASDAAGLAWADVRFALYGLIEALSGLDLRDQPPGQIPDPESWWKRFLRLLRRLIRPAEFLDALWAFVSAVDAFDQAFYSLQVAIAALEKCRKKVS